MRCLSSVVTIFAALALTGCAASTAAQPGAASSASPAASHSAGAGTPADVQACRRLEAYPSSTTVAASRKYVTFLARQGKLPGLSPALAGQMEAAATDLTSYLNGTGSQPQVGADAHKLQSICADYGVTS